MEFQLYMKFWKCLFPSFFTLISWLCNEKWIEKALTQLERWFQGQIEVIFWWSVRTGRASAIYEILKISVFQLFYPHILILQRKINWKRLNPTWQVVLGSNCGHFLIVSQDRYGVSAIYEILKISISQLFYPRILILQRKMNWKRLNPTWQVVSGSNWGYFLMVS